MEKTQNWQTQKYQTLSKSWKTEKYLENEKYQKHKNIENIGWGRKEAMENPSIPEPEHTQNP